MSTAGGSALLCAVDKEASHTPWMTGFAPLRCSGSSPLLARPHGPASRSDWGLAPPLARVHRLKRTAGASGTAARPRCASQSRGRGP